jgi:hypothetical protein
MKENIIQLSQGHYINVLSICTSFIVIGFSWFLLFIYVYLSPSIAVPCAACICVMSRIARTKKSLFLFFLFLPFLFFSLARFVERSSDVR